MLLRAAALYVLFVLASLAGVIAVWQSWEVRLRDSRLAESLSSEEALQVKLQAAIDTALSAERRARLAENTVEDLQHVQGAGNDNIDAMKANLAAALQQASVAETAMTEAENRLADEIAAHASLRAETAAAINSAKPASFDATASIPAALPDAPRPLSNLTVGHIEPSDAESPPAAGPASAAPTSAAASQPNTAATSDPVLKTVAEPPANEAAKLATVTVTKDEPAVITSTDAGGHDSNRKPDIKKPAQINSLKKKTVAKKINKRPASRKTTSESTPFGPLF